MTKEAPKNVAHSVHQRLLNKAKGAGRPFNELLQYFAMERFLYRLSRSAHGSKFVLKGAPLFTAWRAPMFGLFLRSNEKTAMILQTAPAKSFRPGEPKREP